MTLETFKASVSRSAPPEGISNLLQALWHDARGDWSKAHNIAQDISSNNGSWIHAYLHRKEGDQGNAAYWYHRAGRPVPQISPEQEWHQIAEALLTGETA